MTSNALLPLSALLSFSNTFSGKDEAVYLHREVQALDAQLKFRRELHLGYAGLKLQKLKEEREEMDFQLKFAEKRNEKQLDELQKDIFKNISTANITEQSKAKLEQFRSRYTEYLDYHRSHIQREFNYQILLKQNALLAERAILSNQVAQNEKMLKMESEYCEKIHQTNVGLVEEIKRLQLDNARINEKRQRKVLDHQSLEERLAEQMEVRSELAQVEKEEDFGSGKRENLQESEVLDSKSDSKRERRTRVTTEKIVTLNLNHKYGKLDQIRQSQLDELLKKEKEEESKSSELGNSNEPALSSNRNYKESMFKHQPIKAIAKEMNKVDDKKQIPIKEISLEKSELTYSRGMTFGENTQGNEPVAHLINSSKVKPLQSSITSNKNKLKESKASDVLDSIKLSQSIVVPDSNAKTTNHPEIKQSVKDSIPSITVIEQSTVPQPTESQFKTSEIVKDKVPPIERHDSNEFKHNEEEKDKIAESQVISQSKLAESIQINEPPSYETLIGSKPPLKSKALLAEYKLLVLKKLTGKIEKYAKAQKAGKHVYLIKHTNNKGVEEQLKSRFYALLSFIKEGKSPDEDEFASLDINTALQLVFELLSTNPKANLNESNLGNNKKAYDEELFLNDIDEQYKNIIRSTLEHMKVMISTKKISLQLACTFMAKGLLNFTHTKIMESKLLLVLEKLLTQKNTPVSSTMLFANTFSSGFTNANAFYQSNTKLPHTNALSISQSNVKKPANAEDIFDQYQ